MANFQGRLPLVFGECTSIGSCLFYGWIPKVTTFPSSSCQEMLTQRLRSIILAYIERGGQLVMSPCCGLLRNESTYSWLYLFFTRILQPQHKNREVVFPGCLGNGNETSEDNYGEFSLCFVLRSTTNDICGDSTGAAFSGPDVPVAPGESWSELFVVCCFVKNHERRAF